MIDKIVINYEIDVWLLIRNQFFQILYTRFYIDISIYTYHNMCVGYKFEISNSADKMYNEFSEFTYGVLSIIFLFYNIIILFNCRNILKIL